MSEAAGHQITMKAKLHIRGKGKPMPFPDEDLLGHEPDHDLHAVNRASRRVVEALQEWRYAARYGRRADLTNDALKAEKWEVVVLALDAYEESVGRAQREAG